MTVRVGVRVAVLVAVGVRVGVRVAVLVAIGVPVRIAVAVSAGPAGELLSTMGRYILKDCPGVPVGVKVAVRVAVAVGVILGGSVFTGSISKSLVSDHSPHWPFTLARTFQVQLSRFTSAIKVIATWWYDELVSMLLSIVGMVAAAPITYR